MVVYRGSDALYGWVYDSLQALGLTLGAIALCALPVAAGWLVLSTAPGRTQERLATKTDEGAPGWQSESFTRITRRDFAALAGGILLFRQGRCPNGDTASHPFDSRQRRRIPAVGLGTAYVFDENNQATRSKADAVVQALVKNGGRLIDTASTYGDAESVLGEVTATAGLRTSFSSRPSSSRPTPGSSSDRWPD